jgi:hypothetical protein
MSAASAMPVTASATTIGFAWREPLRARTNRIDENTSPMSAVAMPARDRVNSRHSRISAADANTSARCDRRFDADASSRSPPCRP